MLDRTLSVLLLFAAFLPTPILFAPRGAEGANTANMTDCISAGRRAGLSSVRVYYIMHSRIYCGEGCISKRAISRGL